MNTSEIVGKFLGIKRFEDMPCCSFCGKLQSQVKKLIAGPDVYICNECIGICVEIIDDDKQAEAASGN